MEYVYMYVMVVSKLMINKRAFQFIEAPYVTFIDWAFCFCWLPPVFGFRCWGPNQNQL